MKIVKYVDLGHVSDTIRCQFTNCKRRPFLRRLFYLDDGKIIGSSCKNKVEGFTIKTRHTMKTKRNKQHKKLGISTLFDIYGKKPQDYGVTPHSVWIEDKQRNEEEYL